jgi:hypothetical protein
MEETLEPKSEVTTRSIGIKFGLIMAAISVAYFMTLNVAGIDMSQGFGRWGGLIFNVVVIFFAHKSFKDTNGDGYMSYGQGFGIGTWVALISSVISSIFTYIYVKFIDAGFIQTMLEKQEEQFQERGMSDEQIKQAMDMTAKFMTPEMMLVFGLIFGFIILLVVFAIVTIFTQKKNPETAI